MATRDCTGAPVTRELTALPSAVRPCLGGRRWRAGPAAMTTLETEGHRARASTATTVAVDDFVWGGWGAHLVHTHTLCRRAVRFLLLYYARRTRSHPPHAPRSASSVKSEKMRRPRFFFVGFLLQILLSRTSVRRPPPLPLPHTDECDVRTRLTVRHRPLAAVYYYVLIIIFLLLNIFLFESVVCHRLLQELYKFWSDRRLWEGAVGVCCGKLPVIKAANYFFNQKWTMIIFISWCGIHYT